MKKGMIFIPLFFAAAFAHAGSSAVGTSGAQFLKIGAGSRSTAMGDAFVAVADDSNALYFNPAGIAFLSRPEMSVLRTQWFQGVDYDHGAFVFPTNYGAFGLTASTLKTDDIQRRGSDESLGGTFGAMDAAYSLSFAKTFGPQLSLGFTGRYIQERIDNVSAGTWSGDAGVLKHLGNSPFTLGLAVKNVGKAIEFRKESDPLPTMADAGLSGNFFRDRLIVGTHVDFPRDNMTQYGAGAEWRERLGSDVRFALRGGYNSAVTSNGSGLTLGGGIGFRRIDLDFAWVPFGDLGNTFRYTFVIRF